MTMRLPMLVALSVALAGALYPYAPCVAQEVGVRATEGERYCFPDHVGGWKQSAIAASDARFYGLTLAQSRLYLARIDSVTAILRSAPVLSPPTGIRATAWTDFCCTSQCQLTKTCGTRPPYGRIWLLLNYFIASKPTATPFTIDELRTEVELFFNNPNRVFDGSPLARLPDGRGVFWLPQPWGQIGGMTLYHNQGGDDVYAFFTRGRVPLWLPVSREQFVTSLLRVREADLAKNLADVPPAYQAQVRQANSLLIDPLRAQLQAMSATERASQAWLNNRMGNGDILVPANSDDGRPLVALNPDYFDLARPRTDIQLIVLRLEGIPLQGRKPGYANCSDLGSDRLVQLVREVNWARVMEFVR